MPDHVHILLRDRDANRPLQIIVAAIKGRAIHQCKPLNIKLAWQPGFYDRVVRDYELSDEFVNYVLMNPVRAGLAANYGDYEHCGNFDLWK